MWQSQSSLMTRLNLIFSHTLLMTCQVSIKALDSTSIKVARSSTGLCIHKLICIRMCRAISWSQAMLTSSIIVSGIGIVYASKITNQWNIFFVTTQWCGPPNTPTASELQFGWVLTQRTNISSFNHPTIASHHSSTVSGDNLMCKFWKTDENPKHQSSLFNTSRNTLTFWDRSFHNPSPKESSKSIP